MNKELNIEIVQHYGTEDKEFTGECNTEVLINNKTILQGDEYHDSISDQIRGFIKCLEYLHKDYNIQKSKKADEPLWD